MRIKWGEEPEKNYFEFKYLGVIFIPDGKQTTDVRSVSR